MESLEKAAAAAVPDDEDTLYVQQPERPRIKKRSRRFKCAQRLRATEFGEKNWSYQTVLSIRACIRLCVNTKRLT